MGPLEFRVCPVAGTAAQDTSSLPVERIATRTRAAARTCVAPASAARPTAAGPETVVPQADAATRVHARRAVDGTLHRHHRIGARWQGRAGHDPHAGAAANRSRGRVAGGEIHRHLELHDLAAAGREVTVRHGEAVHHRPVERGRVAVGDDRRGEPAAPGVGQPLPARGQRGRRAFHEIDRGRELDHAARGAVARNARRRS
jgi:hypothetical protein